MRRTQNLRALRKFVNSNKETSGMVIWRQINTVTFGMLGKNVMRTYLQKLHLTVMVKNGNHTI